MIEVTIKLGWEADSFSHAGWQYEADVDGSFTLPQEVYFELRDRGVAMEYIEENEIDETPDLPVSDAGAAAEGEEVDSSASSPSDPVSDPPVEPPVEEPVVPVAVDPVTNAPPVADSGQPSPTVAEKPPKAAK